MKRQLRINDKRVNETSAGLLTLHRQQRGSGEPVTKDGTVRICRNLREAGSGVRRVEQLTLLARTGRRPVFADVMKGNRFVFTQEDDGTIYLEMSIEDNVAAVGTSPLGRVEAPVVEGASVGKFVILRLEGGELVYILRKPESLSYSWVGALPALPDFYIEVKSAPLVSEEMEATRFSRVLTELTGAVPADISEVVSRAWRDACGRLLTRIRAGGAWCEPVNVRLALRLWDGTLLQVSDPVRLTPPEKPGRDRVTAGLLYDNTKKGFTGTDAATLSGRGYTFEVHLTEGLSPVWEGLVEGIEIWVSEEPETIAAERSPFMAFIHNNAGNFVSFMPSVYSDAEMNTLVEHAASGRVAFFPYPQTPGNITRPETVDYTSDVEQYVTAMPGVRGDADCILGYGGFLHVGKGDALYTSVRGNPLVLGCVSEGVGSRVRSMRPQLCGGGAFTRQYIYLSTDRGITAVCHKPDGTHTNSRPVSQEPLGENEIWCSTPSGVYALTAGGSLLCLKDAAAPLILAGLSGVTGLLWSNSYEELWICRSHNSLVLCPTGGDTRGYIRTESYGPINDAYSPALLYTTDSQGVISIYNADTEHEGKALPAEYEMELRINGHEWLRWLYIHARTRESGVNYRVDDECGRTLCRGDIQPAVNGLLRLCVPLVACGFGSERASTVIRVRLSGNINEITKIGITE